MRWISVHLYCILLFLIRNTSHNHLNCVADYHKIIKYNIQSILVDKFASWPHPLTLLGDLSNAPLDGDLNKVVPPGLDFLGFVCSSPSLPLFLVELGAGPGVLA